MITAAVFISRTTKTAKEAFTQPEITLPLGITLPPGVTLPRPGTPGPTTSIGFLTPGANPRVLAPVNDVGAAVIAVTAKVAGR